jgi:hypothetical protein
LRRLEPFDPFHPLDASQAVNAVVGQLVDQSPEPLSEVERFIGDGVYALYYAGVNPCYSPEADSNLTLPIYVGKTEAPGGRRGLTDGEQSDSLSRRLRQHRNSIGLVTTETEALDPESPQRLELDDFSFRCIAIVDFFIAKGERGLIETFMPIWNFALDGFGNHDPGAGRRTMERPLWDVLHPGREWALRLDSKRTPSDAQASLEIGRAQIAARSKDV